MKTTKKGNVAFANGYNRIKQTKYGYMMYNTHDVYVGGSFDSYGEFSDEEVKFVCSLIKPGDIVMDIGANYGALTVPMALKAREVIAFEPQRPAFYAMTANLALNCLENVVSINAGLSNHGGFIEVPKLKFDDVNNIGGLSMAEAIPGYHGDSYKVPCYTLDEFVFRHQVDRLDFIKMDVEGMEELVLRGGQSALTKLKPVMYIEADRREKVDSLLKYITELGYKFEYHTPPLFSPNNYFGNKVNKFGNIVSINVVCTPKE